MCDFPVISPKHCRGSIDLPENKGFIPFPSAVLVPLGTKACPWRLRVKQQQQIHISLKSVSTAKDIGAGLGGEGATGLSLGRVGNVNGNSAKCSQFIAIKETGDLLTMYKEGSSSSGGEEIISTVKKDYEVKKIDICQRESAQLRSPTIYTSRTSEIEMYFPNALKTVKSVLFSYQG